MVTLLPAALVAALAAGAAVFGAARMAGPPSFHATAYDPPEPAAEFALTDHAGGTVRMEQFRGKAVLLFFGYTHCPDVCPMTLSKLRRVLDELEATPEQVQVLLITVDPARDTPAVLARYVERFGPGVTGITGTPEALARLQAAYGVHSGPAAPGGHAGHHGGGQHQPQVSHTSAVWGVDRAGQVRVLLRPDNADDQMAEDIRTLLRL